MTKLSVEGSKGQHEQKIDFADEQFVLCAIRVVFPTFNLCIFEIVNVFKKEQKK